MRKGQMVGVLIFRPGNVRAWQFVEENVLRKLLSSLFISRACSCENISEPDLCSTSHFLLFVAQDTDRILGPNSTPGLIRENNVCSRLDPGVCFVILNTSGTMALSALIAGDGARVFVSSWTNWSSWFLFYRNRKMLKIK